MHQDAQKIQYIQDKFRKDISILRKTKEGLLKLFRSRLEEKKIEQIKSSILISNDSNTG